MSLRRHLLRVTKGTRMTSPGSIDADTDLASLQRLEPIASTSQFTLEAPQRAHCARTSLARPVLLDTVSRAGSSTSATASDVTGMPHLPSAAALASRKSSGPTRYVRSASITSLRSLEEAGRLALRRQASTTAVTLTEEPSSVDDETADATPPAKGLLDWVAGTGLTRKRDADSPTPSASALNPADWLPSLFSAKHLPESEGKEEKETDKYLEDEDRAKKGDLPWQRVKDHYEKPRLPIVFCHGLFGFAHIGVQSMPSLQISYWRGVKAALESIGCEMLITTVPTSASIEERAKVLCATIERELPGREVNLIGHSMGGLDARFLASVLQPTTFTVKSVITIATPHRGSTFADYMLDDVITQAHMPKILALCDAIGLPGGGKAFDNLTTYNMKRFNEEVKNKEGVYYGSYGAAFEPGWSNVFRWPWAIIKEKEGRNDGLVSIESARWGEDLGVLEDVDHLSQVGWTGPVRFGFAALLGRPINFKPASFFLSIAENLANRGL